VRIIKITSIDSYIKINPREKKALEAWVSIVNPKLGRDLKIL